MSKSLEPASLGPHLPGVYRFAFLMMGGAASAATVLRRTVERAAHGGVADLRDGRQVRRWLFHEARHQCARHAVASPDAPPNDGAEPDAAARLAARFAALPPAERSALILFYLYLFDPVELAEVLEIPAAELAPTLTRGRALLRETA